jgi:DNA ligase 4
LTPYIDAAFDCRIEKCVLSFAIVIQAEYPSIILDGEMLVWDPVSGRNLPFGTLKTAALGMFSLTYRDAGIYWFQINPRKN